jgi:hypothetical protein
MTKDNTIDQLAAQALVIEKLRQALGLIASGEEVNGCIPSLGWAVDIADESLASTPDYTKLLAERDAALLEEIGRYIGGKAQDEINTMAAIIRAGVTI